MFIFKFTPKYFIANFSILKFQFYKHFLSLFEFKDKTVVQLQLGPNY